MSTSVPIVLSPVPVPVGIQAVNINDLLSIISEYMTATISQNVSFYLQGSTPPNSNQGIFYNTTTKRFEDWSTSLGAYVPISELQVGDMKSSFRQSDDVGNGWILLNGRPINNVTGITQVQKSNLEALFGTASNLPSYSFLSGLGSVPPSGSFSNITNNPIQPSVGVIGNQTISSTYLQSEIVNFRNNTELLSASTTNLQTTVAQIQSVSEQLLQSLVGAGAVSGPKWFVFCGYPS